MEKMIEEKVEVLQDRIIDFAGMEHPFVLAALVEERHLSLGLSICHPDDKFDEKVGILKAIGRARYNPVAITVGKKGYLEITLIRAFLNQESEYIKRNPEAFIPGYKEAKEKYMKKKEMESIKNNFSEIERIVVEKCIENPKFLDNVDRYLTWINRKKCKQSGK